MPSLSQSHTIKGKTYWPITLNIKYLDSSGKEPIPTFLCRILEELHQDIKKEHGENLIDFPNPANSASTSTTCLAHRTGGEIPAHGRDLVTPPPF